MPRVGRHVDWSGIGCWWFVAIWLLTLAGCGVALLVALWRWALQ